MPSKNIDNIRRTSRLLATIFEQLDRKSPVPVIISGKWGTGKSTLLRIVEQEYQKESRNVRFITGLELTVNPNLLDSYNYEVPFNTILIIDDFHQINERVPKEALLKLFREGRKYGISILLSSQPTEELAVLERQAFVVNIGETLLRDGSDGQQDRLSKYKTNPINIAELFQALGRLTRIHGDISAVLDMAKLEFTLENVLKALAAETKYQSELFLPSSGMIVQPEQKPLIIQANVIQRTLIEKIGTNMEEVMKLTSRQFEEFVAEIFEKEGFRVELTQQTRDNGKDIIVTSQGITGKSLYYVECKKRALGNNVEVGVIQRLHGVVVADKATKGIVVTTSLFSDPAIREVKKIEHQMTLMDHVALYSVMQRISGQTAGIDQYSIVPPAF